MKEIRSIYIRTNETPLSKEVEGWVRDKLLAEGFEVSSQLSDDTDMAVCIGGDGALLRFLRSTGFPQLPIVGVNTGHLGFFMEFEETQLDELARLLKEGSFSIQRHRLLKATVYCTGQSPVVYKGINDFVIRKDASSTVHLELSIGSSFIEKFSGDGILISSPAGSTSYNYSVGGSIVDPRVAVLLVSPIAPMNTNSYRSFTSSVVLPPDMSVVISAEKDNLDTALVIADGLEHSHSLLERVVVALDDQTVQIVRRPDYDFWTKVKEKFF